LSKKKIAILGSGITGLSAALCLLRNGFDVQIFEKRNRIGGLVGGKIINNNIYEYGPHFFHTNNPGILLEIKNIVGKDLIKFERTILIKFMGQFFTFPLSIIEVLKKLPKQVVFKALFELIGSNFKRIFIKDKREQNSEMVLLSYYGNTLYELFFKNYIKLVWGIGPEKFSPEFAIQRIPRITASLFLNKIIAPLRAKLVKKSVENFVENVDGQLFTTKKGYRGIVEKILKEIEENGGVINLNSRIMGIETDNGFCKSIFVKDIARDGAVSRLAFDGVISTLPINEVVLMMSGPKYKDLVDAANFLEYRALVFVGILVNKPQVLPVSFMYFREHSFNRVYDSSYFGHDTFSQDTTILVSEISCKTGDRFWTDEKYCKDMVLKDLLREKIIDEKDILEINVYRYKHGYPVYKLGYEKELGKILDYFAKFGNFKSAGRQGLYQYINGHIAMQMGFDAAKQLIDYFNKKAESDL